MENLPINIKEVTKIDNHGIGSGLCKLGVLSFESDKYICAREVGQDGQVNVLILEMENNMNLQKKKLPKVDAAMMHPTKNIIVVRAKNDKNATVLSVFNFDKEEKLKSLEINHNITFWKWLNEETIGIVTDNSVLTLNIYNKDELVKKVFDKSGNLANSNVFVMYLFADKSLSWFSLAGISSFKDNSGKPVINGYIQLYNTGVSQSQSLEGFCPSFGNLKVKDDGVSQLFSFIEKKSNSSKYTLMINEVSGDKNKFKITCEINIQEGDFPVSSNFVESYGLIFVTTNLGYLYIFEVSKGVLIFRCKASEEACLFSARNNKTGGMFYITKSGKLLSANIEKSNLIPFLMQYCKNIDGIMDICTSLAQRYEVPGAEKIFDSLFKNHMQSGNYEEAAKVCAMSPGTSLRNIDTINLFKSCQGNPSPILVYYQVIMSKGKLNEVESVEIAKPLVMQNKKDYIENWFKEGKFTCSEELADLIKPIDNQLSLKILFQSGSPNAHAKIVEGLVNTKQYDKIFPYCQQYSYKPNYAEIIKNVINTSPEAALGLAKLVCSRESNTYLVDVNTIFEIFASKKRTNELSQFMVVYLKDNRSEDSLMQTKVIEMNLYENPQFAKALFDNNVFSYYDKKKIAQISEKLGLYQICLENYTDIEDIRRVMMYSNMISPDFLIAYFGRLEPENQLTCLNDLLRMNPIQNMNLAIEIAVRYASRIPINELIKLFEKNGSHQGLFLFINRIINSVEDPDIILKYIQAGVITNNFAEVQRVIKDYDNYDPQKVLQFFLDNKLVDHRPLILLCDKYDYIEKLTTYLWKNNLIKAIENYAIQIRPQNCPRVLAVLLDEDCEESHIKQILNTVRGACPIEPLVEQFLKRHKLKVLQKFLEDRESEGNNNTALHNALAMIYIENNNNPKDFLMNNKHYDSKVVGKFCEDRDPHLACICYKRAGGSCDDEFIDLTNRMNLYRLQAQYLVESLNPELWKKVLNPENEHKKSVTDQVITVILPHSKNSEEVAVTVKAFVDAGLQGELMDLLEKIVLHNSEFSKSTSLQNLLIINAMTSAPHKVKAFLTRLEDYDGLGLGIKCLENELYEEAFFVFDKFKDFSSSIDVLLYKIQDLKRATIYAEKINTKEVWSSIGKAKLEHKIIDEAIDAFLKSNDCEKYIEVIDVAEQQEKYEDLIKYLLMVREIKKDKYIDGELVFSYAMCDKLTEIESFIVSTNTAELGNIADRLFTLQRYKAAKILYENQNNNSRLASCLVHLKEYQKALAAAKKANSPKCWKEVCFACIKGGEYRLAAQAASNIIIHPDTIDELIKGFEMYGAYNELIFLFETNLNQERNHIYTELAILYAKYQEEKLMDYCRQSYEKFNVPKVIRICEQFNHWNEVVFLHCHYNGHDQAIEVMIQHSPICFKHDLFTQTLQKISNTLLYNEAIHFYIQEDPQDINDMLKKNSGRLDLSSIVHEIRKTGYLSLFLPFLKSVQSANNYDVNEAINEILLEEEDPESLKVSILEYASFDQISLAKKIENHHLLEFRRISALVYRKNKKYQQSIDISKKLEFYKDAIETAFESQNSQICEDLLKFFASTKDKECFCACLYTCYDLIKPDVAMELAWRYDFNEFLMPYMIQNSREMQNRLDYIQRKLEETEKEKIKKKEESDKIPLEFGMGMDVIPRTLVPYGGNNNYGNNQFSGNMNYGNDNYNYGGGFQGGMNNFGGFGGI